jgi:hypothetical protein
LTVDQEVGDSNSPGGTRLSLEIDGLSQAVGQIGISDPLWNTCPYTSIVSSRQLWWWSAPTVAYGVKDAATVSTFTAKIEQRLRSALKRVRKRLTPRKRPKQRSSKDSKELLQKSRDLLAEMRAIGAEIIVPCGDHVMRVPADKLTR